MATIPIGGPNLRGILGPINPAMVGRGAPRPLVTGLPVLARPGFQQMMSTPVANIANAAGPTGLAAFLQRPGLSDALIAFGSAMLAQKNQPYATLGSSIGNALPLAMQVYEQDKQQAAQQQLAVNKQQQIDTMLQNPSIIEILRPGEADYVKSLPIDEQLKYIGDRLKPKIVGGSVWTPSIGGKGEFATPQYITGQPDTSRRLAPGDPGYLEAITAIEQMRTTEQMKRAAGRMSMTPAVRKDFRAMEQASSANDALNSLDKELTNIFAYASSQPGKIIPLVANFFTSSKGQEASTAAKGFINPVVRFLSGAQMNASEADRYYQTFIPRPGDGPEAIARKARMRQLMVNAMDLGLFSPGEAVGGNPDTANIDAAINYIDALAGGANSPGVSSDLNEFDGLQ